MSVDLSHNLFKTIGFTGVDYLYQRDQEAHITFVYNFMLAYMNTLVHL